MILLSLLLVVVTIVVIVYPLFFQKLIPYHSEQKEPIDMNEKEGLLSALTDLEEEYQLGRLSQSDYQSLKLHFQRRYLRSKQSNDSEN